MTRRLAAAAAAYCALAVILTWPLVLRLSSTVPHDLGDPLLSTSILWWNAHVMPLTERWWNGFAFFPAKGMLAFSDHRLGESLIASPLQWIGCSPIVAYNVTLLSTFPLSALAAHWLGFTLTQRHDAAALCGLAFGFNPYRMAHLEHLELLASFGLPAMLASLHLYLRTRQPRRAVAFAAAFVVQGLCTSYYLAFFGVFLLLWIAWFIRWRDRDALAWVLVACASGAALLLPIALGYLRIHQAYGLRRDFFVISLMGADVTSLVSGSNLLALWKWTSRLNGPERQLFPGLTVALVTAIGIVVAWRTSRARRDGLSVLAAVLLALAAVFVVVAALLAHYGPFRFELGPLTVAGGPFFKPLSVAVALAVIAAACSSRMRQAWQRKSLLCFYTIATGLLFVCSFGPTPRFLGEQVLYEAPYLWLMRLPVFATEIRVPARFGMLAVLALSAAAAVAFDRLPLRTRSRRLAAIVLALGIVLDTWPIAIPMPALPDTFSRAHAAGFDAVAEVPIDAAWGDAAAMYRAMDHSRPVVNGISGYIPAHYIPLMTASAEHDDAALDALAETGRILFVVDRRSDPGDYWRTALASHHGSTPLGEEGPRAFFTLQAGENAAVCRDPLVPVSGVFNADGPVESGWMLLDGRPDTVWGSRGTQAAGDFLTLDLGRVRHPCSLVITVGREPYQFPRMLNVATSPDNLAWTESFNGSTSAAVIRGAISRPAMPFFEVPLPDRPARYIRMRLEKSHPTFNWVMADVAVRALQSQ